MPLSLIFLVGVAFQARAHSPAFDEYQVKAAFLYNFAKFVEWPAGTFTAADDPIGICIVGQNPFGSTLEDMIQGTRLGGRSFTVRRLPGTKQASKCKIVFIGAAEGKRIRALLEALKGSDILTVGETGIMGFKLEGTRVRIQVALESERKYYKMGGTSRGGWV